MTTQTQSEWARAAASDLAFFLGNRVKLTDDCRTAINRAFLAFAATPPSDRGEKTWGEWALVNRLRDEEADTVTVLCDNPEGPPNNAVECCGFWTGFVERRFEGDTIGQALAEAVAAKDEAARVGYPDAEDSTPDTITVPRVAKEREDVARWHDEQARLAAARQSSAELIGGNASKFDTSRKLHEYCAAVIRAAPTSHETG